MIATISINIPANHKKILNCVKLFLQIFYKRTRKRLRLRGCLLYTSVSARLVNGIEYLMKKNKITVYRDYAYFKGKKEI